MKQRPDLHDDLIEVYESFYLLGAGRGYNEAGPQPIPTSEIIALLEHRHVVNVDERVEFLRLIRAMDARYLTLAIDKLSRDRERLLAKSRSSSGR